METWRFPKNRAPKLLLWIGDGMLAFVSTAPREFRFFFRRPDFTGVSPLRTWSRQRCV